MNWSLPKVLGVLLCAVAVVTVAVATLAGNPIGTYLLNHNFLLGTAAMVVGLVLVWSQRPDPEEPNESETDGFE